MREIEYLIAMAVGSEPSYSEAQRGRYRRILLDKKLIKKWGKGRGTRVEITARGLSIVSQYQSGDRIGAIDFLLGLNDNEIVSKAPKKKPMPANDVGRISRLDLSSYQETDSDIAMATRWIGAWEINTPPRLSTAINDGTRAVYIATAAKLIRREIEKNRSMEAIEAMIDNVTSTTDVGHETFSKWLDYVTDLDYIFVSKRSKASLWRPRVISSSTGSDIAKRRIAIKKMRDKIAVGQGDPYAYYRLIGFVPEDIKQQLKSKGVQHEIAKEVVARVQSVSEDAYIESGAIVELSVNDFLNEI